MVKAVDRGRQFGCAVAAHGVVRWAGSLAYISTICEAQGQKKTEYIIFRARLGVG